MKRKAINWQPIRAEYIKDETVSYRSLAKKYKISLRTLADCAKKENWVQLRQQKRDKSVAKTIEATSDIEAAQSVSISTVADKLLEKISNAIETGPLTSQAIKHYASALKDIKDLKGEQPDSDGESLGVVLLPMVTGEGVTDG